MTMQPESKDKVEQKIAKDELSEKELEKASGGRPEVGEIVIVKHTDQATL